MKKREAVSTLAMRYYRRLVQRAGGMLPPVASERGWQGLAEAMRISAGPLPRPCPKEFKARLFFHRGLNRWFIIYTPDAHARQRCEMICHELVEYMTHQEFGSVIDRTPRYSFAFDGGARPADIRHQISLAVTRMAFGPSGYLADRARSTGQPVLDALLQTGQLRLAIDLPTPVPGDDFTPLAHGNAPERFAVRPDAARWPHRSGRCRCGCRGTLAGRLE